MNKKMRRIAKSTTKIPKRTFFPVFIPLVLKETKVQKLPTPLKEHPTEDEIRTFHDEYRNYYEYHKEEPASPLFKVWISSMMVGAVLGVGVGINEARNDEVFGPMTKVILPITCGALGVLGGALPPLGAWAFYDYMMDSMAMHKHQ